MKLLSLISNNALARILQDAIVEQVPIHIIQCINRYAMTLSTDRIPANILRKETFQYYKAQIDIAAARSARARAAAAKRRAARQPDNAGDAATIQLPVVRLKDVSATARCPRRKRSSDIRCADSLSLLDSLPDR